ncbi:MAG: glutaminyl-peptide cyclotransferase [Flavobacteriia bacterium]
MKRYVIIGLIAAVILSMILVPMMRGGDSDVPEEDLIPATFGFEENLATKWDETVQIEILINEEGISKLELIYNDSTLKTWTNPSGKITIPFNAGFFGLGARSLKLLSTMSDGSTFVDERMVRVLSDIVPEIWIASVVKSYSHNSTSFTQGLEFSEGVLYEGTGQRGQSMVAQVDLNTGTVQKKMGLDATYFGEGITILGDKLYQLTWQEQKCFVYNKKTFQLEKDIPYVGEGWGLCHDGTSLIMSNGTERITFRDPKTFEIQRTIEVYSQLGPVTNLNELEYADDLIYANVWMTNKVAVIDPNNGKVLAEIDATELTKQGRGTGDVLNGIAYNEKTEKWYMTGKNWIKLFEVEFKKPQDL